jgi:hypothetical protein
VAAGSQPEQMTAPKAEITAGDEHRHTQPTTANAATGAPPPGGETAVNPARAAAVAKIKAALLAAALDQPAPQRTTSGGGGAVVRSASSAVGRQPPVKNGETVAAKPVKRSLSTGDSGPASGLQQRPLIWDFFEEGRSVGTCRWSEMLWTH